MEHASGNESESSFSDYFSQAMRLYADGLRIKGTTPRDFEELSRAFCTGVIAAKVAIEIGFFSDQPDISLPEAIKRGVKSVGGPELEFAPIQVAIKPDDPRYARQLERIAWSRIRYRNGSEPYSSSTDLLHGLLNNDPRIVVAVEDKH